jgi:hypothetical protein
MTNNQFAIVRKNMDTVLAEAGALDFRPVIMAQAAIMKVDEALLEIPENVGELIKSMHYTRKYGLVPGVDMHVMPFNSNVEREDEKGRTVKVWEKRISVVVGEQAYKKSAKAQALRERDFIDFETEELTQDELETYVKANLPDVVLTSQDRGVRARVLSASTARMYRDMGRKYSPEWSYGFCFLKGPKDRNGKFRKGDADRIPNQRTPLDVATRRAVKNAIMKKYPLMAIDDRTPEQRIAQVVDMAEEDTPDPHADAMPLSNGNALDDDCLFVVDEPLGSPVESPSADTYDPDAEWRAIPDAAETDAQPRYAHLRDELTDNALKFVEWCASLDSGDKPCTEKQYGFLLSLIRGITGEGTEEAVLEVMFGASISADGRRPGFKITKQLLDILPKTRGRGEDKQPNESYRADVADIIKTIGQMVQAA